MHGHKLLATRSGHAAHTHTEIVFTAGIMHVYSRDSMHCLSIFGATPSGSKLTPSMSEIGDFRNLSIAALLDTCTADPSMFYLQTEGSPQDQGPMITPGPPVGTQYAGTIRDDGHYCNRSLMQLLAHAPSQGPPMNHPNTSAWMCNDNNVTG